MRDYLKSVLLAVVGALLVTGVTILLDRTCGPFWPVWLALLVFTIIGCVITIAALTADFEYEIACWIASITVWGIIFGVFVFAIWERRSLSPLWYGAVWCVIIGVAGPIGDLKARRFLREHALDNPCPHCGAEMRYSGQAYVGSTDAVGSSGYGTRTAHYETAYRCPKCGYERAGRG